MIDHSVDRFSHISITMYYWRLSSWCWNWFGCDNIDWDWIVKLQEEWPGSDGTFQMRNYCDWFGRLTIQSDIHIQSHTSWITDLEHERISWMYHFIYERLLYFLVFTANRPQTDISQIVSPTSMPFPCIYWSLSLCLVGMRETTFKAIRPLKVFEHMEWNKWIQKRLVGKHTICSISFIDEDYLDLRSH